MTLLATDVGLGLLADTARHAVPDGRPKSRLDAILALLADDLSYVEGALDAACESGEAGATHAARHLVGSGGKRIRPILVMLSAACFGPVGAAARELAVVAELVHSATLLHDDVVDDGDERRGRPTARRVFGNAVSVLAGDLLLTHALDRTLAAAPPAMGDLLATLRRLVDGEVVQLRGRTRIDASEETYLRILHDKTASLFGWAARAGALTTGATEPMRERLGAFGEHVGVAFQLVDDLLDYAGDPTVTGKTLFGDIGEGKLTLPLVLALAAEPGLSGDLASARAGDELAAHRLGNAVRASGVCDVVRARAARETAAARECLAALPSTPARELLAAVALELVSREG